MNHHSQHEIRPFLTQALWDYTSYDEGALSFRAGEHVLVRGTLESGWWYGRISSTEGLTTPSVEPSQQYGWFPSNWVQRVDDDQSLGAGSSSPHALYPATVVSARKATRVPPSGQLEPTTNKRASVSSRSSRTTSSYDGDSLWNGSLYSDRIRNIQASPRASSFHFQIQEETSELLEHEPPSPFSSVAMTQTASSPSIQSMYRPLPSDNSNIPYHTFNSPETLEIPEPAPTVSINSFPPNHEVSQDPPEPTWRDQTHALRHAMAPPLPPSLPMLAERISESIQRIINSSLRAHTDETAMESVTPVITAIRDIIYASKGFGTSPQISDNGTTREDTVLSPFSFYLSKVKVGLTRLTFSARACDIVAGNQIEYPLAWSQFQADALALESEVSELMAALWSTIEDGEEESGMIGKRRIHGALDEMSSILDMTSSKPDASGKRFALDDVLLASFDAQKSIVESSLEELYGELRQCKTRTGTCVNLVRSAPRTIISLSSIVSIVESIDFAPILPPTSIPVDQRFSYLSASSGSSGDEETPDHKFARNLHCELETLVEAMYKEAMALLGIVQLQSSTNGVSASTLESIEKLITLLQRAVPKIDSCLRGLVMIANVQSTAAQQGLQTARSQTGSLALLIAQSQQLHLSDKALPTTPIAPSPTINHLERPVLSSKSGRVIAINTDSERITDGQFQRDFQQYINTTSDGAGSSVTPPTTDRPGWTFGTLPRKLNQHRPRIFGSSDSGTPSASRSSLFLPLSSTTNSSNVALASASASTPSLAPAYLSLNLSGLILNENGDIKGGTLSDLVAHLVSPGPRDTSFIDTFLLTFRSFTTLSEFVQLLIGRFNIEPPEGLSPDQFSVWEEKNRNIIRLRVISILKSLLQMNDLTQPGDQDGLREIHEFATEASLTYPPAKRLIPLVYALTQGDAPVSRRLLANEPKNAPQPILPEVLPYGMADIMKLSHVEVARQLTLMEAALFQGIIPKDCIARGSESSKGREDTISAVIHMSNKVSNLVGDIILRKDDARARGAAIRYFVSVAEQCRFLRSLSMMQAVMAGLNSSFIRRLKHSWVEVGRRAEKSYTEMDEFLASVPNLARYRAMLHGVELPCLPFIGVWLTAMVSIQQGNSSTLPNSSDSTIINWSRCAAIARTIQDIAHYQSTPFNLWPVDAIQAYLTRLFALTKSPDEMHNLSMIREPRGPQLSYYNS